MGADVQFRKSGANWTTLDTVLAGDAEQDSRIAAIQTNVQALSNRIDANSPLISNLRTDLDALTSTTTSSLAALTGQQSTLATISTTTSLASSLDQTRSTLVNVQSSLASSISTAQVGTPTCAT